MYRSGMSAAFLMPILFVINTCDAGAPSSAI
jgi:hypothetical protein